MRRQPFVPRALLVAPSERYKAWQQARPEPIMWSVVVSRGGSTYYAIRLADGGLDIRTASKGNPVAPAQLIRLEPVIREAIDLGRFAK